MAYKEENNPSNPDAIPLYNDNILKVWNWFKDAWNCNDWMTWYGAMKKKYGAEKARNTFLTHWNDLATGSSAIDCRSFDTAFRDYMKKEGMLDALYSGLGTIAKPIGVGTDVATSLGDAISDTGKGLKNVGKVLKIAIPVVLIVAIGFGGYWTYNHFIKKKS